MRILIVEDDAILRKVIASMFTKIAVVHEAESGNDAIHFLKSNHIDLVFSDVMMPNGSGVELLDWVVSTLKPMPPVVLVTGEARVTAEQALRKGAHAFIPKPFKVNDLRQIANVIKAEIESGVRSRAS